MGHKHILAFSTQAKALFSIGPRRFLGTALLHIQDYDVLQLGLACDWLHASRKGGMIGTTVSGLLCYTTPRRLEA